MDKEHEDLRSRIDLLSKQIKGLQNGKENYQAQHHKLYLLRNTNDTKAIDEQKKVIATLSTPEQLDEEIASIQNEIVRITQEFWAKDFIDEPLRLSTTKTFKNKYCEIRKHPNGNWYLYENSEYATPKLQIILDETGVPKQIVRTIQGVETDGRPVKHIQNILIDQPEETKILPKPEPTIDIRMFNNAKPLSLEEKNKLLSQATTKEVENIKEVTSITRKIRKIFED